MIPKISLENLKLSKIICGTNQFVGITHRYNPIDMLAHLIRFRKVEKIAKFMLHLAQEHGVNCTISSPRDKVYEAIKIVEKETGEPFYWICSPSHSRKTAKGLKSNIFKQIDWCADRNIAVCIPHRSYTDWALDEENLTIGGNHPKRPPFPEVSNYIRDKGMIPGLSCHFPKVIEACEKNNYDVKLIVQPLNKIGFQSPVEPSKLIKIIQNTKIQIINIKPMAAGRINPREGISFCLKNIKENDLLAVGFGKFEYCVEDGKLFEEIINS